MDPFSSWRRRIFLGSVLACAFPIGSARAESCASAAGLSDEPSIRRLAETADAIPRGAGLSASQSAQYDRYLVDTLNSLDRMRMPNGMVVDKVQAVKDAEGGVRYETLNGNTSPTNIGLDLLIQIELLRDPKRRVQAEKNLRTLVATLEKLPHHQETGLFYSWYQADNGEPRQRNVSSVDNIHLALALWAAERAAPDATTRARSAGLFRRMNFSPFVDPANGLIGGNLQHVVKEGRDTWFREPWNYSNYGAEARSIYGLSHALGVLRDHREGSPMITRAPGALKVEMAKTSEGEILRTWDGGAFQLLLPRLLIQEGRYSPKMKQVFENYSRHALEQGRREGIALPAGYSACNFGVDDEPDAFRGVPSYVGKAGSPELVSQDHAEFRESAHRKDWNRVVTPHAVVLAAAIDPAGYATPLAQAEKLGREQKLYEPGVGWMDGLHVRHEHQGKVIPAQLSLDQSMLALSILEIRSSDGMTASSRLLSQDPSVRSKLQEFYSAMEPRLEPGP